MTYAQFDRAIRSLDTMHLRCCVRLDETKRLPLSKLKADKIYKRNRKRKGRNDGYFTIYRHLRRKLLRVHRVNRNMHILILRD